MDATKGPPAIGYAWGGLIPLEEALRLSERLYPIGNDWGAMCEYMEAKGLDAAGAEARRSFLELAGSDAMRAQLRLYWTEWAKDRLAALAGPVSILRGVYPPCSAYKSPEIARLRAEAARLRSGDPGETVSPQVEPTTKREVERMPDDPVRLERWTKVKEVRQEAARRLGLLELDQFSQMPAGKRYQELIARASPPLLAAGFKLDSHRRHGLVYRKRTRSGLWDFVFVDDSRRDIDRGSIIPSYALTLPGKAVLPGSHWFHAVATLLPEDLIPKFDYSTGFQRDSFAEFCMSVDTVVCLTQLLFERMDAVL